MKKILLLVTLILTLGITSCSTDEATFNEGADEVEESVNEEYEILSNGVAAPLVPENTSHGYLLDDASIPKVSNCSDWWNFWTGIGPSVGFQVAKQENFKGHVSTQVYIKNMQLDIGKNGILCDEYIDVWDENYYPYIKVVNDIRSFLPYANYENALIGFKSGEVSAEVFQHHLDVTNDAHAFWSQFSEKSKKVQTMMIFTNSDRDAYINRLKELDIDSKYENVWGVGSSGGGGTAIPDKNGNVHVVYRLTDNTELPWRDYMFHETTHAYQEAYGQMYNWIFEPCWFGEGYAMVIGLSHTWDDDWKTAEHYKVERTQRIEQLNSYFDSLDNKSNEEIKNSLLLSHSDKKCNSQEPLLGYRLGMLVSEAWILEFGFQNTVDFLVNIENNDFEASFEKEFGISMNDWLLTKGYEYVVDALGRSE